MIALISANWLLFLIALVIGVATAFWTWAASGRDTSEAERFDANDGLLEKAGDAVPKETVAAPITEPSPAPVVAATTVTASSAKAAPAVKLAPRPRKKPIETMKSSPAPAGKPKIAPAQGEPDNLRLIKGVGPKLNTLLNELGVTRFDQISNWKADDITEVDQYLETFSGRITRDSWIDQAKFLAKDDIAGFEKKYGKL